MRHALTHTVDMPYNFISSDKIVLVVQHNCNQPSREIAERYPKNRHRDEAKVILGALPLKFIAISFVDGDGDDVQGGARPIRTLRVSTSRDLVRSFKKL